MSKSLYALILAGDGGERFWPLSRRSRPKHLAPVVFERSLLECTLDRLEGLLPPERILILASREQEAQIRAQLPLIPTENIVIEPAKRETAAAIALGAGLISRRDRSAVVAVLPSDHVIRDVSGFQRTLLAATLTASATDRIVMIGVRPTWACPRFGYIELGPRVEIDGMEDTAPEVHEVCGFREKPNAELAENFLRKGGYRWNAGIFVWTVQAMMGALDRHVPKLAQFMTLLHSAEDVEATVRSRFRALPRVSLDYAVMEKAVGVLAVEAAFDWDDVGDWTAAAKYWTSDASGNASRADLIIDGASNNIVYAEPGVQVALMGVHDLVIIRTPDALLICDRHAAEKIKGFAGRLPAELQ